MDDDTVIAESEVPDLLNELNNNAMEDLEKKDYRSSLQYLNHAEEILEAVTTQGGSVSHDMVLLTLHNSGLILQRLGQIAEWSNYIDGWIFNAKHYKVFVSEEENLKSRAVQLAVRFKKQRYICKSQIQLCALLSQSNKHDIALAQSNKAIKTISRIFSDLLKICRDHNARFRKSLTLKSKSITSAQTSYCSDLLTKSIPILEYIVNVINKRKTSVKVPKLDLRSVLGVQHVNDEVYTFNIGDMMQMQPLKNFDKPSGMGIQSEFTKDLMFEKICMLVIAYFWKSTEIRFLNTKDSTRSTRVREAQVLHRQALTIANNFLPAESPLLQHIKSSFSTHYSPPKKRRKRGNNRSVLGRRSIQKSITQPQQRSGSAKIRKAGPSGRSSIVKRQRPASAIPRRSDSPFRNGNRPESNSPRNRKPSLGHIKSSNNTQSEGSLNQNRNTRVKVNKNSNRMLPVSSSELGARLELVQSQRNDDFPMTTNQLNLDSQEDYDDQLSIRNLKYMDLQSRSDLTISIGENSNV